MMLFSKRHGFARILFLATVIALTLHSSGALRKITARHAPAVRRLQTTEKSVTNDGFTHWKKTVNTGCSFDDHSFTLDTDADPTKMNEIRFVMNNFDVDYEDPNNDCEGGPEVDLVSWNGKQLGYLTGANNAWSINSFSLTQADINEGSNAVAIDTDSTGTGCWCLGVGYIEVRAKVYFQVKTKTPANGKENLPFKKEDVDISVEFTEDYDAGTLTAATFLVGYKDQLGKFQQVPGSFQSPSTTKFKFVPSSDLKDGVHYRITVKGAASGVKSTAGALLPSDLEWWFWTVPNLDLTEAFTDQKGSACEPGSSPCKGVEIAVYQAARNADIVSFKHSVARVFLRWKPHTDVFASEQVKEIKVDLKLTWEGVIRRDAAKLKRQDQHSATDRQHSKNSINVFHTPLSAGDYSVEVIPMPQSSSPIKYTGSLNLSSRGEAGRITYNLHYVEDAPINAAQKITYNNIIQAGNMLTREMFPIYHVWGPRMGTINIGYTPTGRNVPTTSCGMVREVKCPWLWISSYKVPEYQCILDTLGSELGGKRFVMSVVPAVLCPGAAGLWNSKHVILIFAGGAANAATVTHEIGHEYGISRANVPTRGHRNDNQGIEGFQVSSTLGNRGGTLRSFYDDSTINSVMSADVVAGTVWIDNDDYDDLLDEFYSRRRLAPTGDYLIVIGRVDSSAGTVLLAPAFLQNVPNDLGQESGQCSAQLQNAGGSTLQQTFFDPGEDIHVDRDDGSADEVGRAGSLFSVSLLWDDTATRLFVDCGSGITGATEKTANPPTIQISSPSEGSLLSGSFMVEWTASDPDGDAVAFQLQTSEDNGSSWDLHTLLMAATSFSLDTTLLPNSGSMLIRIMATDGFNVAFDSLTVSVSNDLPIQSVFPVDGASDVALGSDVIVTFQSDVLPETLTPQSFLLLDDSTFSEVTAKVYYDSETRTAVLVPNTSMKASSTYTVQLLDSITGASGESFSSFSWSFTTEPDVIQPSVIGSQPVNGAVQVPINPLIQVEFDEDIEPSTLTASEFQLVDDSGSVVSAASLQYFSDRRRALLTPTNDLKENSIYQIRVGPNVADLVGNLLSSPFQAGFTTGDSLSSGVRIVGNFLDVWVDEDGDSLYEALDILVDVEVLSEGFYNLNARLLDSAGRLIDWTSNGGFLGIALGPGVHRLKLRYESSAIRNSGLNGPYTLDSLSFYEILNPGIADTMFDAFDTFPYDNAQFFSMLNFGPIQDQIFEVGEPSYPVIALRELTSHASEPIESITYSLRINTSPFLQVSIDSAGILSFNPQNGIEIESEITVEARDTLGNRVDARFTVIFEYPIDSPTSPQTEPPTAPPTELDATPEPTASPTEPGHTPEPTASPTEPGDTPEPTASPTEPDGTPEPTPSPTKDAHPNTVAPTTSPTTVASTASPTAPPTTVDNCSGNWLLAILQFFLGWFLGWFGFSFC